MDRDALPLHRPGIVYRGFTVFAALWITVALCFAILGSISELPILEQTARNLYFHVPMWFVMYAATLVGAFHSFRYLTTRRRISDIRAKEAWIVAVAAGVIAFLTGVVWSRFTWFVGTNLWWNGDPRQVMTAIQILIGGAYFVLRGGVDEPRLRARLAAVYALFATTTMPFLTYVLPRQMASLHPGAEGNPAFSQMDIAPDMRWVFYACAAGFLMLGWWIYRLRVRVRISELRTAERFPSS